MEEAKEIRTLADLQPDEHNANKGTPRGLYMVEKSLEKYGAGRSVLADRHGRLIAGNKTVEAAASLGIEEVEVIRTDGKKLVVVQREDLDLEEDPAAAELAFVDNQASAVGLAWDPGALNFLQQERGANFSDFVFPEEWAAMTQVPGEESDGSAGGDETPDSFQEYGEDIPTEHKCPSCGYKWSGKGG